MKITKKSNKRIVLLAIILFVAVVVITIAVLYTMREPSNPVPTTNQSTTSNQSSTTTSPGQTIEDNTTPEKPNPETPSQTTSEYSVSISRVTQLSDGTISVRTNVNGTTTGTCHLTFSGPNATSFERTVPIEAQESTYKCQNVDLERNSFNSGGSWSVNVYIEKDSKLSQKVNQTFTVE